MSRRQGIAKLLWLTCHIPARSHRPEGGWIFVWVTPCHDEPVLSLRMVQAMGTCCMTRSSCLADGMRGLSHPSRARWDANTRDIDLAHPGKESRSMSMGEGAIVPSDHRLGTGNGMESLPSVAGDAE